MNKEELQKKCANLIGVSASEKELAFEVLQDKILEQLKNDSDAIRIKELGVFQFKVNDEDNTGELIFSPMQISSGSRTLFLRLPVKRTSSNDDTNIDDIFSLSVGKPIVPLASTYEAGESDSSFVFIKKKIEERVNEILSEAEVLRDFNLWDDYLKSIKKDEPKGKSENDSSALLHDLTEPETKPEEEELDPYTKSYLTTESDFYSFPVEEDTKKEVDDFFEDFETFKNLSEHEETPEDEFFSEEKLSEDDDSQSDSNKIKGIFDDEEEYKQELDKDDTFDIDKAVFNSVVEDDKFDWNWGDELKSEIPDEETPVVKPTKIDEDETPKESKPKKEEENLDDDPFGTLEKTLEMDPEFQRLSGEHSFDEIETGDREYRITNLSKPREVPPKPKTRITRLTSPVEEPIEGETPTDISEKESVYRSFRERNSNSNVFVIAGIIVILVVIIYFAFSMSEEPPKDVIKPSTQTAQAQPEENIVTTEPPVSTEAKEPQINQSAGAQPDNSSKVEEIRISNLIFRRGNEYNVQVSSWRSAVKADAEVKRLKAKGYNAFVVQAYLPSKGGTWHRVRIGGFKSEEQARNFLNNTQL